MNSCVIRDLIGGKKRTTPRRAQFRLNEVSGGACRSLAVTRSSLGQVPWLEVSVGVDEVVPREERRELHADRGERCFSAFLAIDEHDDVADDEARLAQRFDRRDR